MKASGMFEDFLEWNFSFTLISLMASGIKCKPIYPAKQWLMLSIWKHTVRLMNSFLFEHGNGFVK